METITNVDQLLSFRTHTPKLFEEILNGHPNGFVLQQPLQLLYNDLRLIARRCAEINDPQLNWYMAKITMYSVADPGSPEHDPARVQELKRLSDIVDETREAGLVAREINSKKGGAQ